MIHKYGIPFMDQTSLDRYEAARAAVALKYPGINLDINDRWEKGVDHHPKSLDLMKKIMELDFHFMSDYFCWKSGGDGDNGESLMYLLDIVFEAEDLLSLKNK